jgi:O-antigen ligase
MLWILIGYMFLFIHRPFEVWPTLGAFRLELYYMMTAGLFWLVGARKGWLPNFQHAAFAIFTLAMLVCWLASPWSDKCEDTLDRYFKMLVFYLMVVTVVRDEQSLKKLVIGFLAVMFLYQAHSVWEYLHGRYTFRMGIPRLMGIDITLGDPNSFGASIVYALPFVPALWRGDSSPRLRFFLGGYVALSVICIGLTGSRSSFLGMVIWAVITVLQSPYRWRALPVLLLLAPMLFFLLPGDLQNRFVTIVDPSVGPVNAQKSAEGRLVGLMTGLEMWGRMPLTGCGPGAWKQGANSKFESHNLYGQVLGEMGCVGAAAFVTILLCFGWNLYQIRKITRTHPEWGTYFPAELSRSIGVAILLLLFEGNLGHNLFRHNWLWFGAFLIVARHCVELRRTRGGLRSLATRLATPGPMYGNGRWAATGGRGLGPALPGSTSWRM